jgi:hypothetical protein
MSEYILTHKHHTHPHAASGWRIHCGVEVTELSTNKQHSLSSSTFSVKTLAWTSMIKPRFSSRVSRRPRRTRPQRLLTAVPSLAHLGPLLAPTAFVDDGYIGLGVPIGTDAFVQHFVKKKC